MVAAYRIDEVGWAQMATGEGQLAVERVNVSDDEGCALVGVFSWVFRFKCPTSPLPTRSLSNEESNLSGRPSGSLGVAFSRTSAIPMGSCPDPARQRTVMVRQAQGRRTTRSSGPVVRRCSSSGR